MTCDCYNVLATASTRLENRWVGKEGGRKRERGRGKDRERGFVGWFMMYVFMHSLSDNQPGITTFPGQQNMNSLTLGAQCVCVCVHAHSLVHMSKHMKYILDTSLKL